MLSPAAPHFEMWRSSLSHFWTTSVHALNVSAARRLQENARSIFAASME
jgi:hypothetical protein